MAADYHTNVFINCPFDEEYTPLFDALLFSTYDCGFYPRCALEISDSSQVRIEKITSIIGECRLSIHDISRTAADRRTKLPRFNMPLELGIVLGAKAFGSGKHKSKSCIILDLKPYRYQKYLSDIAGQDIRAHNGKPSDAICQVRDFLSMHHAPDVILPGGLAIVQRYHQFRKALPNACIELQLDEKSLNFRDLTTLIVGWMNKHPFERTVVE